MTASPLVIRPETLFDYAAIANVHLRAFGGEGSGTSLIPSLHRQRPGFDPRLSLVAERDGQIIGHVLYSPRAYRLFGETVVGLNLSPLGVLPQYHRQGVGAALCEAGDAQAQALGYAFCLILGHKDYYTRFGYTQGAYGFSSLEIPAGALPTLAPLATRAVQPDDADALRALWLIEEGGVDLSVVPDETAAWWHSPDPRVNCTVYLDDDGAIVGYTRQGTHEPTRMRLFLAADGSTARRMAAQLAGDGALTLPLHPSSSSAAAFADVGVPACSASPYCLGKSFVPSAYDAYMAAVSRGERPVGRVMWPAEFDV